MQNTPSELLPVLLDKLQLISKTEARTLKSLSDSITVIQETLSDIRRYLELHTFSSPNETIHFYKRVKPEFDALLLYFFRLFRLEQACPLSDKEAIRKHYTDELSRIQAYYDLHREFVRYYRLDATHLDHFYFIPQPDTAWTTHQEDVLFYGLENHAPMSTPLASIKAFDRLQVDIAQKIAQLDNQPALPPKDPSKPGLRWTRSKADLIELMYALKAAKVFNDGDEVDIRQIANWLQSTLHIDLGNYYRVFQSIRIRKKVRTQFCGVLDEALTQFMNDADEHPRY